MKKKILLVLSMVALLVCLFAISVSAETVLKSQTTNAYGDLSFFDESVSVGRTDPKNGFTPYISASSTDYARVVMGDGTTFYTFPTAYILSQGTIYGSSGKNIYVPDFTSLNSAMEAATGTNPNWTAENVYRIELPNTVNRVNGGTQNFAGYTNVIEIRLQPNSAVQDAKNMIFWKCKNLETIHNLDTFVFTNGSLGGSFQECAKLTNLTIGVSSAVTSTGENMFSGCTSLVSVNFQEAFPNLQTIGKNTFYQCHSLAHLSSSQEYTYIMPNTVTSISQSAFFECKGIKYISISPNVTYIGPSCFHTCPSLQYVDFNNNQNDVDFNNWGAFMGCTSLKAMSLPTNTDYITNRFFSECKELQAVYLPSATKTIETNGYGNQSSFYNCNKVYFVNEPFSVRDANGNFYGDSFQMPAKPDVYYFPSNLTNLFERDSGIGFAFCYNLNQTMVMPTTLTKFWINDGVFYCCGDKGNKTTVVFLGNMTDLRIGMRESRAKGISYVFANSADTDFSSVNIVNSNTGNYSFNLNGDEFIYFCSTGKGITMKKPSSDDKFTNDNTTLEDMDKHSYVIAKETAPTCTKPGVKGYVCFCEAVDETRSEVIEALGHKASETILDKYFLKNADGSYNYFENMVKLCECTACNENAEFEIADTALFITNKGYSFSETDASSFSYTLHVNVEAIKAYLLENATFKYGVVVSANIAKAPIELVDGAVNKNASQTVIVELQGSTTVYEYVMTKLTFAENYQASQLYCQAYAVEDDIVSYISPEKISISAEVISHAILVEKYESKEDLEKVA